MEVEHLGLESAPKWAINITGRDDLLYHNTSPMGDDFYVAKI